MALFTVPVNTRFGSRLACDFISCSLFLSLFLFFLCVCYVPHKLCKVAVRECGGEKMDAATLSRSILSALQSLRLRSEKWKGYNRGITLRLPPPDELLSVWPAAVHPDLCRTAILALVPQSVSPLWGAFLWFAGVCVCVWLFLMADAEVNMKRHS